MTSPFMLIKKSSSPFVLLPITQTERTVHLRYLNDHGVAARFIEAVQLNPDDAWAFVSKLYAGGLDLNALREILWAGVHSRKWVHKAVCGSVPKNFITRSLYVSDPERGLRRLVHLRMVKEPDKHGVWKVCAIEQEDCPRGV
ncbi:MAG: hypothetical protein FWC16_08730 [Defluviitaleaceae bacterium]|nr:hypothetical protein [Defluviitaleaceae bacterium]MCL2274996.1 hypothetical protein [Defluviitaleaceae bacterium]